MRGFIVLCLCAAAMAAPQGYNYNQGGGGGAVAHQQSGSFGGSIGAIGGGIGGGFGSSVSSGGGFVQGGQQQSFGGQQQSFGGHQQQQQAVISKRFFIHTAPEDVEEDYKEKHITVGVPKKNYNVVFIKSPSKSNKKTAIKISPAPNEEKTVIYVLNKKTDASDIHAEVIEHPTTTAKPEVFFIKYKTNEEAAHAQEQIQAQYDALGGSSQVTDEGVGQVTSVIGSLDNGAAHGGAQSGSFGGAQSGSFGGSQSGSFGGSQSGSFGGSQSGSFGGIQSGSTGFGVQQGGVVSSNNNNAYLPPNFY